MGGQQHADKPMEKVPSMEQQYSKRVPIEKVEVLQASSNLTVELVPGARVTIVGINPPAQPGDKDTQNSESVPE